MLVIPGPEELLITGILVKVGGKVGPKIISWGANKFGAKGAAKKASGAKYEITRDKNINPTQEIIPNTNIPKSFTLKGTNVNGKEVWVHGNASKHMEEFIKSAKGSIITENELMLSFQESVSSILPKVNPGRNFFNVNGWEIGINGDTGGNISCFIQTIILGG
ncbi:hypothetical protein BSX38_00900 [Listeria monocytogenes]|nr:hypothetical protein [Listeria monocytogenes]EAE8880879.1 hypothetical protein [Listeria monocytogenes]EAE8893028.1 hypothetical protein [Listeria monocytogenes]EAV9824594.1 hypothetical protein [Listeria monocytogenes]EDO1120946.1 hypothetical protein [Listeria monocytogenes]